MKMKAILTYILFCALSGIVFAIRDKINNVRTGDLLNAGLEILGCVFFGIAIAIFNQMFWRKK